MSSKLSYAWVRNTPLFKSVSTGLTFDEKHKLAVDLMVAYLDYLSEFTFNQKKLTYAFDWQSSPQGYDHWKLWGIRCNKTTTKQ